MSKFLKVAIAALTIVVGSGTIASAGKYQLGRVALPEEIAAWDIDVRPDGQGLPKGSGKVADGETLYADQCAACHGDFGEGKDRWPVLVGGQNTLKGEDPVKTIGSFWPYASTVFDYVRRTMPFGNAQSLSADEVYALTAYLLYMNEVIKDDQFVLSDKNFTSIRMPNEKNFTKDSRPDTPLLAQQAPCMKECKSEVKIVSRARVLDVTPKTATKGKPAE